LASFSDGKPWGDLVKILPVFLLIIFVFSVPAAADSLDVGQKMISGGLSQWALDIANNMLSGSGFQTGQLNHSENYTASQVLVFGIAAYQIDVFQNPVVQEAIGTTIPFFKYMAVLLLIVITLFILLQIYAPETAGQITKSINGRPTYYEPRDILEYVAYIGFWFLGGPFLLWAELEINNYIVKSMMLDVLNQVSLSSDNLPLYFIMCFCYLLLLYFVAVRMIIIYYGASVWYLLGLVLAVKRTRWLGILIFLYVSVQIFMQAIIVSVTTFIVKLVISGSLGWISSLLVYGGLTLFLLGLCIVIELWPLILQILKPATMKTILYFSRYAL
jgi:hypothetical protein